MQTLLEKSAMNFFSRIGTAAVLMLLASAPAAVADIYNFTFTSSGMNATGTIDIVGGVAQSGSINVTGVPLEADSNTLITAAGSLLPASGATDARDHDGDVITYDNVVNLVNDPILNGNGLGFGSGYYGMDGGTPEYNTVINLWGNSPGSYGLFVGEAELDGNGNVIEAQWVYAIQNGSLTLTPVPEPSTLVLLGIGAISLIGYARRRRS